MTMDLIIIGHKFLEEINTYGLYPLWVNLGNQKEMESLGLPKVSPSKKLRL